MEEIKQLSDDVIEQIKDFGNYYYLNEEQRSLIDKLILDEELKERYKRNGLCHECKHLKNNYYWCRICNAKRFQQNFKNWCSGNDDIDKFIQKAQLKAENNQWEREGETEVALKCLHKSQGITAEFLGEVRSFFNGVNLL